MPVERSPRVKPSKRPRYRYILFHVEGDLPDRALLIRHLQASLPSEAGPWLTRYESGRGILRVLRGHESVVQDRMTRVGAYRLRTVSTSGTIAALERRHGDRRRRNLRQG